MRRFFIETSNIDGRKAVLTGSDARHARRVLRMKSGDRILLFDGQGEQYHAEIVDMLPDSIETRIVGCCTSQAETPLRITIAQAFLKEKKMDGLVRQVTELGVSRWVPFFAERSVPRPDDKRLAGRMERWRKIVKETMKQCRRLRVPEISPPLSYDEVMGFAGSGDVSLLFWEKATRPIHEAVLSAGGCPPKDVLAVIGPEGGFSDQEIERARHAGLCFVSLGVRILRAETATVAVCALLQYLYGDMA